MNCNLKTSLQTPSPSPNSTQWNWGFSPWIFSNQRLFVKSSLAKYRKICTQEHTFNILWGLFFPPFHSKTTFVENFYAFAINYSLCNLTVFMESPLWMEKCASFSLLHVVLSLPLPQLESAPGDSARAWTDKTVQFCPTWYYREILCSFSTETMPSWHLCLSFCNPSLVSWKFFAGKKETWASLPPPGASPFMSSWEVELGFFCQDNCMTLQQKSGLCSLPGTVWRKTNFLACYIFFYLLKFCINTAK